MDVVLIGTGYPGEMPLFTRGLAELGARVIGVGDQPQHEVPDVARHALAAYIQIPSWADEDGALATMLGALRGHNVDLVESLWEPTMLLAARLREAIGVPGLTVEQTVPFRDKGRMKEVLEAAGIRTPRSARSTTVAGCREAAEQIGYPLIIKPIAGAGSLDTYRIEDQADFEDALARLGHIPRSASRSSSTATSSRTTRCALRAASPSTTSAGTGPDRSSGSRSSAPRSRCSPCGTSMRRTWPAGAPWARP